MPSLGNSGLGVRDASGNGNHGDFVTLDMTNWSGSRKGLSILNGGNLDYLDIPGVTASAQKTLSIWLNLLVASSTWTTLWEFGSDSPWLGVNASQIFHTYPVTATSNAVTLNEWMHVAFATRTGFSQWYINGKASGSSSATALTAAGVGLGICRRISDTAMAAYWTDCLYYERCLSPGEIKTLYKDSKVPFRRRNKTISYTSAPSTVSPIQMLTINNQIENSILQR